MGHGVSRDKQRRVGRPRSEASRSSSQDSSLDAFNKWPPSDPNTPINLPSDDENWALEYPWAWAYNENEDPWLAVKREREYFQALYQSSINSDAEVQLHEAVAALTKRRQCRVNPVSNGADENDDDSECSDWESYAESETLASLARQQREELEKVCQLWSEDESSVDPPSSALIATVSSKASFSWQRPSLSPVEFPISCGKVGLDGSPVDLLDIKDDPCLFFRHSLTSSDTSRSFGVYTLRELQTSDKIYKMDIESSVDSPTKVTRMRHELEASCEASGTLSPGESSVDPRVDDTDVLANGRATSTDADKLSDVDRFGCACNTFETTVFFKSEDCLHITRHQPSPEEKRETSSRSAASCCETDEDEEDEETIDCFDTKGNIPSLGESSVNDATPNSSRLSLLQSHALRRGFLPTDDSQENSHWSDLDMMLVASGAQGVNVPVQSHSTQEVRAACFEIGHRSKSTDTIYDNNLSRSVADNSSSCIQSEGFSEIFCDVCNNKDVDKLSIDGGNQVYLENVSAISTETFKSERSNDDEVIDNAMPFCAVPDHTMSSIDNDAFMNMSVSDVECDIMDPRCASDADANDPRSLSDMTTSSTTDVSSGTISPCGDFITDEVSDESVGFLSHAGITLNRLNTKFQRALNFSQDRHCFGSDTQQIAANIETTHTPMCEIDSMLPDFLVEHPISHQAPVSAIASMNVTEADESGEESLARDQMVYNHNKKAAKARTNSRQLTGVLPVDWSSRSQREDEIVSHDPAAVSLETVIAVSSTSQLTTTLWTNALCETFEYDLQAFPHQPLYLLGSDVSGGFGERILRADEHRQGSPHQSESLQSTKSGGGFTSAIKDLSEDHLRASAVTNGLVYRVRESDENYQESSVDESAEINIETGRDNLQTYIPVTALISDVIREDVLKDIPDKFEVTAQDHLPGEYRFEDKFGDLCKYGSTGTRPDNVSNNTSVRSSMIFDDSSVDAWSDTSSSRTVMLVDGVPIDPTAHRRSGTYDDFIASLDNGDRGDEVGSFQGDDHMGEDELDTSVSVSLKMIGKMEVESDFFRWDDGAVLEQGKSGDKQSQVKSCEEYSQEDDSGDGDHDNQLRVAHLSEARMVAESSILISESSAALLKPGQLLDRIITLTPNMAWSTNSSSKQESLPEYNLRNRKADGQNIYTNQNLATALDTARLTSEIVVASDSIRIYNATSHTVDTIYSSAAGDNNTTIPPVMQIIGDIAEETIGSVNEGTLCELPGDVKGEHDATESEENGLDLKQKHYNVSVPQTSEEISIKHQDDTLQMGDKKNAASLDVKQTALPEIQEKINVTKEREKIIDQGTPESVVPHTSNNTFCENNITSPEVINDTFPEGPKVFNKLAEVEASEREGDIAEFIEVNTEVLESVEDVVGIKEPRNIIEAEYMVTEDKSETQKVRVLEKTTDTDTSEQGDVTKHEEPENGLSGKQHVTSHEKLEAITVEMTLFEEESDLTVLVGEDSVVLEMQQDMTFFQEPHETRRQLDVTSCEELKDSEQERKEDLMVNEKAKDIVVSEGQGCFRVFGNLANTVMSLEEPDNTVASEAQSAWTKLEDSEDTILEKQNVTILEKSKDNEASEEQYTTRIFEDQNCIVTERKEDVTVIEKSKYTAVSHKQDKDTIFQEPEEAISEEETAQNLKVISKLKAQEVVNNDPQMDAVSEGEYQASWPEQNVSLCEGQKVVNLFERPEDASPVNEDKNSPALQLSKSVKVFDGGKEEPEDPRISEMHEGVVPSRASISLSKRSECVEQFVESRDVKGSKEHDDWSADQTKEDTTHAGADSRPASAVPVERQLPADSQKSFVTSWFVTHRHRGLSIEVMNRSHMAVNLKINRLQTEHVVRYKIYDPHPITIHVPQEKPSAKLDSDIVSISEFERLLPGEDIDYTLATDMCQRSLTAVPPEAVDLTKLWNTESCKSLNKTHSLEAGDGCIQTSSEKYQHDMTAGPSVEVREGLTYPAVTITETCGILMENFMASEATRQQNENISRQMVELIRQERDASFITCDTSLSREDSTLVKNNETSSYWSKQVAVGVSLDYQDKPKKEAKTAFKINSETVVRHEEELQKVLLATDTELMHRPDSPALVFSEVTLLTTRDDVEYNQVPVSFTESYIEDMEVDFENEVVRACDIESHEEDRRTADSFLTKEEAFTRAVDESANESETESSEVITNCLVNATLLVAEKEDMTEGLLRTEEYEAESITDWSRKSPLILHSDESVQCNEGVNQVIHEAYEDQEIEVPACDWTKDVPVAIPLEDGEVQIEDDNLVWEPYETQEINIPAFDQSEEMRLTMSVKDKEAQKEEGETLTPGSYNERAVDKSMSEWSEEVALDMWLDDQEKVKREVERSVLLDCKTAVRHKDQLQEVSTTDTELMYGPEYPAFVPCSKWSEKIEKECFIMMVKDETLKEDGHIVHETCAVQATDIVTVDWSQKVLLDMLLDDDAEHHFDTEKAVIRGDEVQRDDSLMTDVELVQRPDKSASVSRQVFYITPRNEVQNHTSFAEDGFNVDRVRNEKYKYTSFAEDSVEVSRDVSFVEGIVLESLHDLYSLFPEQALRDLHEREACLNDFVPVIRFCEPTPNFRSTSETLIAKSASEGYNLFQSHDSLVGENEDSEEQGMSVEIKKQVSTEETEKQEKELSQDPDEHELEELILQSVTDVEGEEVARETDDGAKLEEKTTEAQRHSQEVSKAEIPEMLEQRLDKVTNEKKKVTKKQEKEMQQQKEVFKTEPEKIVAKQKLEEVTDRELEKVTEEELQDEKKEKVSEQELKQVKQKRENAADVYKVVVQEVIEEKQKVAAEAMPPEIKEQQGETEKEEEEMIEQQRDETEKEVENMETEQENAAEKYWQVTEEDVQRVAEKRLSILEVERDEMRRVEKNTVLIACREPEVKVTGQDLKERECDFGTKGSFITAINTSQGYGGCDWSRQLNPSDHQGQIFSGFQTPAEAFQDFRISSGRTSDTDDILGDGWPAPSSTWVHEEILIAVGDSQPQTSLFDDEQVSRPAQEQTGCDIADKTSGLRSSSETHSIVLGKESIFSEQQLELFLPETLSKDHLTDFRDKTEKECKEEQVTSMISDTEGGGLYHSNLTLLTEHSSSSPINYVIRKEDDDAIARQTHEAEKNYENREEHILSDIRSTEAPDTIHECFGVNTDVLLQVHIADIEETDKSLDLLSRPSEESPAKDYDVDMCKESGQWSACGTRHTDRWAFFADGDEWTADKEEFEAQLDVVRDLVVTLSDRLGFEMNVNTMDLVEVIDALAARIEVDLQQQHGIGRLQRRQSLLENAQVMEELSKRYESKFESDNDTDIMRELQLQTLPTSSGTAGTSNMEESDHLIDQTRQEIYDLLQQIAALTSVLTLPTACSYSIQKVEPSLHEVCPLKVPMSSMKRLVSVMSALPFVDIPAKTDFQGIVQTDQRHDSDHDLMVQTDQIHEKTGQGNTSRCSEVDVEVKEDDDNEAYRTSIDDATSAETADNTLEVTCLETMSLVSDDNSSDEAFAGTTSEAADASTCDDMLNTRFISLQSNKPEIRPLLPVRQDTSLEYEAVEENFVFDVVNIVTSATQGQLIDDKCCTAVYKASDENLDFNRREDVASLSLIESLQSDTDAESCQDDIIYNDTYNCLHDPKKERILFAIPRNPDIITSDDTYSKYLSEEDTTSNEENFSCALDFSIIRPIKEFSPKFKQEMPSESFVSSPFLPTLQKSALLPESEHVSSYDIANDTDRATEARHVTSLFRAFSEDPQSSLIFKLETVYLIGTSQRDVPPPKDDDVALARIAVSQPAGSSLLGDNYSSVVSVKIGHYDLPRHLSEMSISMSSSFTREGLDLPAGLEDEVLECEPVKEEQTWNQVLSSANTNCIVQESFERGDSVELDKVAWSEMRSREIKGTSVEESKDPPDVQNMTRFTMLSLHSVDDYPQEADDRDHLTLVPTSPVTSCVHITPCTNAPPGPYIVELMSCDEASLVLTQSLSDFNLRTLDTESDSEKGPRFESGITSCDAYLDSNQFLELAPLKTHKEYFTKVSSVQSGPQDDQGEVTLTSHVVNLHRSLIAVDAKYFPVGETNNVQNLKEFDDVGNYFRESDDVSLAFESDDDVSRLQRTTERVVASKATAETATVKDDLLYSTRDSKPLEPEQGCGEEQAIAISDWDNLSNILPGEDTALLPEKVSVRRSWQSKGKLIDRQEEVLLSECPLLAVNVWQLGNHQNIPETADDETIQKEALRSVESDAPQEEDAVIVQASSGLPVKHSWDPLQLVCDASVQETTLVSDTLAQESAQLGTLASGSTVTEKHAMLQPALHASRVDAADLYIGYEEAGGLLHLVQEATDLMRETSSARSEEATSKVQPSSESRTKDDEDFLQHISDALVKDAADMEKQSDTPHGGYSDLKDVIHKTVKKTLVTVQATSVTPVDDTESLVELTCNAVVEENEITELSKPLYDEPFKKATGLTQPFFEEPVKNTTYMLQKISNEQLEETTDIAQPNLEEPFEKSTGGLTQQISKKSFEETTGLTQTTSEEPLQISLKTTELLQTQFGAKFEDTTGHVQPSVKASEETTDLAQLIPEGLSKEATELTQAAHNAPADGSTDREVLINDALVENFGRAQSVFDGPLNETADQVQETLRKSEEPTNLVQTASYFTRIPEENATDGVHLALNTPRMPEEASHLVRLAVDVPVILEKEATNLEQSTYGTPRIAEEEATDLAQPPSDTPANDTTDPEQQPHANNSEKDEAGNQYESTEKKVTFQGTHGDKNRTNDYENSDYEDAASTGVSNRACGGLNQGVTDDIYDMGSNADTHNAKSNSFEESDDKSDEEEDKLRKHTETEDDKQTSETLTAEESHPPENNNKDIAEQFDKDHNDEVDKGTEEGYDFSFEENKRCCDAQTVDEILDKKDQDSEKTVEEEDEILDETSNASMNHPASLRSQESGSVKSHSYVDDEQKEENIERKNDKEYIKLDSKESNNEPSELLRYEQLTYEEGELKEEDQYEKTEEATNSTECYKYLLSFRKNEEGYNYERECDDSRNQRLSAEVDEAEKDTWDSFMHLPVLDDPGRHASEIAENLVNEVMETEKAHLESIAHSEQGMDMQASSDSVFFKDDLEIPASTVSEQISSAVETSKTVPSMCSDAAATLKTISTLDLKKSTLPRVDQTGSKEEDKGPGLTKDLESSTAAVGPQSVDALLKRETTEKDTSNVDRTQTKSDSVLYSCVSLMSDNPASVWDKEDSTKPSSMLSVRLVKSDTEDTIVFDDSRAEEASLPVIDVLPSEVDLEGDIPNDYDTPEFAHLLTYELATALTHEIVLMAEVEVAMEDMDDDSNSFSSDQDEQELHSHELAEDDDSHLKETEGGGFVSSESEEDHLTTKLMRHGNEHITQSVKVSHEMYPLPTENTHETPETGSEATKMVNEAFEAEDEKKSAYVLVSDSICSQSLVYSSQETFAPSSDDDTAFTVLDHDTTGEETLVMRRLKADKQGSTCQHTLEADTDTVKVVRDEAHLRRSYTSVGSEETQGSISEATTTSGEYIINSRGSVASDDSEEQSTVHNHSDDIQSAEVYTDKQETVILPRPDFAPFSLELDLRKPKAVISSPIPITEDFYWEHAVRGAAAHLSCDDWLQFSKEDKKDHVYHMKQEYRERLLMSLPAGDKHFRVSDIDDMENSSYKETDFSQVLSDLDLCTDKQTLGNAAHSDGTPMTSTIRATFENLKFEVLEAACEEDDVGDFWIKGQNILFQKIVPSDEDKDIKVMWEEDSLDTKMGAALSAESACVHWRHQSKENSTERLSCSSETSYKTIMGINNKNDEENKARDIVADSGAKVTCLANTKDDLVRDNSVDVFTTQNKAIIHCQEQQDADSESDSLHAEYDFVDSSDTENYLHDGEDHFSKVSDDDEWEVEDRPDMSSDADKNKAASMARESRRGMPEVDMTTWPSTNADSQPTGDVHSLIEDDTSRQEASCLESEIIHMPTQVITITDSPKDNTSCQSAGSPAIPKESEITEELITKLTSGFDPEASEDAAASEDFSDTGSVALLSVEDDGSNFEASDVLDVIEVGDVLVDSDEVPGDQGDEKEAATKLIPSSFESNFLCSKISDSVTPTGNLAIEQQVEDQESAVSCGTELDGRIRTLQGCEITQNTGLTLSLALELPSFIQETGLESCLTQYQHDNLPISSGNPVTKAMSQPSIPYEQLIQFPTSNLCTAASVTEIPSKEVNGVIVRDDMTELEDKTEREKREPKITTPQQSLSETEAKGTGRLASASKTVSVLKGTSSKDSGCLELASHETGMKKKKKQKKKISSVLTIETANLEEDKDCKPTTIAAHSGSGVLQIASPFTPAIESKTSDAVPKVTVSAKKTKKKKKSVRSQNNDPTTEHKGELQLISSKDTVAHFLSHVHRESVPLENFSGEVSTAFEQELHAVSLSACKSSGDVKTPGDLTSQPGSHIPVKEEQRILTEQKPKQISKISPKSTAASSMPKRDQTSSAHAPIIQFASHRDPVLPLDRKREGHSGQLGVDTCASDKSTSSRRRQWSSRREKQPLETQQQHLFPSSSLLAPHAAADKSGPFQRRRRCSQRHHDNASDFMLASSSRSRSCRRQEDPNLGLKVTSEGKRLHDDDDKDFGVAMARLSVLTGMRKKRKHRNNIVVVEQSRRF